MLRQCIGQFLFALQDPEPTVRRVALVAFNSAVHNKPSLVRDLLPELLPWLYSETKVKVSIRVMNEFIGIDGIVLICRKN